MPADSRMSKVREFLNDDPNRPSVKEFAEFWRGLTDEEKTEYAEGAEA